MEQGVAEDQRHDRRGRPGLCGELRGLATLEWLRTVCFLLVSFWAPLR